MRANGSAWFTSSYSGQNGDCVEARRRAGDGIDLRDSKDRNGPAVTFGAHGWAAFSTALRDGTLPAQ
ncbi:DUF397 domain-containing protein [Streptomyces sp. NPDC049881]|uniref:DUF397 domain-containing protein n=1 Tax=Streptomyces sp. NPDC049881 TaxID=3155778 RepID=UPI0034251A43